MDAPQSRFHISKLIVVILSLFSTIWLLWNFLKNQGTEYEIKTELTTVLKNNKNENPSSSPSKLDNEESKCLALKEEKKVCPSLSLPILESGTLKVEYSSQVVAEKTVSFKYHLDDVSATHELIPKTAKHHIPKNKKYTMDDFKIIKKLRKGANAVVYKGVCIPTGQPVAIKVYSAKAQKAELQYAKDVLYANLLKEAPFIIRVHFWKKLRSEVARKYFNSSSLRLVLVMELAAGGDLFDCLHLGSWTHETVKKLLSQILVATQYMHGYGIIHRDLKLENILLTRSGDVRVCDFGYSKRFKTSHHKPSALFGTLEYIPPEIILGSYANYETDIFALGMLFYHFIAEYDDIPNLIRNEENVLYNSGNFMGLVKMLQDYQSLPVRKDAPVGALELFMGMVHPDPNQRFTLKQVMESPYFNGVDWPALGALNHSF